MCETKRKEATMNVKEKESQIMFFVEKEERESDFKLIERIQLDRQTLPICDSKYTLCKLTSISLITVHLKNLFKNLFKLSH